MKRIYILVLLSTSFLFAQHNSTPRIIEMRGITNLDGSVTIIYQLKEKNLYPQLDSIKTNYYALHTDEGITLDTVLFKSLLIKKEDSLLSLRMLTDYSFLYNNFSSPLELYNVDDGNEYSVYMNKDTLQNLCECRAYQILQANKSSGEIFITTNNKLFRSINKGDSFDFTYSSSDSGYINLIGIDTLNNNGLIGVNENSQLTYQVNQFATPVIINNDKIWNSESRVIFVDEATFFILTDKYNNYNNKFDHYLYRFDGNNGSYSFQKIVQDTVEIYFASDNKNTHNVYYALYRKIFKSNDGGDTFILLNKMDTKVTGLYAKPNSEFLYISTSYTIKKINTELMGNSEFLKRIETKTELDYLPLAKGNVWFYNVGGTSYEYDGIRSFEYNIRERIVNKIKYEDKTFWEIETDHQGGSSIFKRGYSEYYYIDSSSGKLYITGNTDNLEFSFLNLTSVPYDTNYFYEDDGYLSTICIDVGEETFADERFPSKTYYEVSLEAGERKYLKGVGMSYRHWGFDFGEATQILKGAVINGKILGDTLLVGVQRKGNLVKIFSLSQNYPNPFNPTTKIKFTIPNVGTSRDLSLRVYDVLGREIKTLLNKPMQPGSYEVEFDGSNLPSGVYFYRIVSGEFTSTKKMLLLK